MICTWSVQATHLRHRNWPRDTSYNQRWANYFIKQNRNKNWNTILWTMWRQVMLSRLSRREEVKKPCLCRTCDPMIREQSVRDSRAVRVVNRKVVWAALGWSQKSHRHSRYYLKIYLSIATMIYMYFQACCFSCRPLNSILMKLWIPTTHIGRTRTWL